MVSYKIMITGANKKRKQKKKLSKSDPDFFTKIATMAGDKVKRKYGKGYFSKLAKKSHPRKEYNGGRPKKKTQRRREKTARTGYFLRSAGSTK
jgi:hypothetical protein